MEGLAHVAGGDICRDGQRLTAKPYPPSSKPGNHPHRRTGLLSNGFTNTVKTTGNLVLLTVYDAAPYYKFVNGRTATDPVKATLLAKWIPALKGRIRQSGASVR